MKLRVTYIPQVPMQPFTIEVDTLDQARLVADTLITFSAFEFDNKIKPDYTDALDLEVFEDGEWVSWHEEDSGYDFNEWLDIQMGIKV